MTLPAMLAAHILIGCTALLCLSLAVCAAGRLLRRYYRARFNPKR